MWSILSYQFPITVPLVFGAGGAAGDATYWGVFADQASFPVNDLRTGDLAFSTADLAGYRYSGVAWELYHALWDGVTAGQTLADRPATASAGALMRIGEIGYAYTGGWETLLASASVTSPAIALGTAAYVDATLSNPSASARTVGLTVTAGYSLSESAVTVPAGGSATVRITRTAVAAASGTLTITEDVHTTAVSVTSAGFLFSTLPGTLGSASHAYAFAAGSTLDDSIGALPITNNGTGTFGAAAITGAAGSLAIVQTTEAAYIANADWTLSDEHTVIYALTPGTLAANRGLGYGPGNSSAGLGLVKTSNDTTLFIADIQNVSSTRVVATASAALTLVVHRRVRTLAGAAPFWQTETFLARAGVSGVRQHDVSAATSTVARWWFGGNGTNLASHAATYHFLHVYDRALTVDEINLYATMLGVSAHPG